MSNITPCSQTPIAVTIIHFIVFNVIPMIAFKNDKLLSISKMFLLKCIMVYQLVSTITLFVSKLEIFYYNSTPTCWIDLELSDLLLIRIINLGFYIRILAEFNKISEDDYFNLKRVERMMDNDVRNSDSFCEKICHKCVDSLCCKNSVIRTDIVNVGLITALTLLLMTLVTSLMPLIYTCLLATIYAWPYVYITIIDFILLVSIFFLVMKSDLVSSEKKIRIQVIANEVKFDHKTVRRIYNKINDLKHKAFLGNDDDDIELVIIHNLIMEYSDNPIEIIDANFVVKQSRRYVDYEDAFSVEELRFVNKNNRVFKNDLHKTLADFITLNHLNNNYIHHVKGKFIDDYIDDYVCEENITIKEFKNFKADFISYLKKDDLILDIYKLMHSELVKSSIRLNNSGNIRIFSTVMVGFIYFNFLYMSLTSSYYNYGSMSYGDSFLIIWNSRSSISEYYYGEYNTIHDYMLKLLIF